MQFENLTIPQGLMQALADYLGTRPYREVAPFMEAFTFIKAVDQVEDEAS